MPLVIRSFDEIFNSILIDYQNQFPGADTSQGSTLYIKSGALASALWGLYKNSDFISRGAIPITAPTAFLDFWANTYGVPRQPGESDADLLERFLDRIRNPPAGGNKTDIEIFVRGITSSGIVLPEADTDDIVSNSRITNAGFGDFDLSKFFDTATTSACFSTSGASAGANWVLDLGVGNVKEFEALGLHTFDTGLVSLSVAHSDDGVIYTNVATGFLANDKEWNFAEWSGAGPHRYWKLELENTPASVAAFNEVEFYETGVEDVSSAQVFPNFLAIGTFHVIVDRTGVLASNKLLAKVRSELDDFLPIAPHEFFVLRPIEVVQDVTMAVTDGNAEGNLAQLTADIDNFFATIDPGEPLFVAQLILFGLNAGYTNAAVSVPSADVIPGAFDKLVKGVVSITEI